MSSKTPTRRPRSCKPVTLSLFLALVAFVLAFSSATLATHEGAALEQGSNSGTTKLVNVDDTLEYSTDNEVSWTPVPGGAVEVDNIAADIGDSIFVREIAGPSASVELVVTAEDIKPAAAPTASLEEGTDPGTTKLTNVDATMQYQVNTDGWEDIGGAEEDNIPVNIGDDVHVRVKATLEQPAGDTQTLSVAAEDIKPAAAPTASLEEGSTVGTTKLINVDDSMEYNVAGGGWEDVAAAATEVDDIDVDVDDEIHVRVKETGTQPASETQTLTVAAGDIKSAPSSGGGGGGSSSWSSRTTTANQIGSADGADRSYRVGPANYQKGATLTVSFPDSESMFEKIELVFVDQHQWVVLDIHVLSDKAEVADLENNVKDLQRFRIELRDSSGPLDHDAVENVEMTLHANGDDLDDAFAQALMLLRFDPKSDSWQVMETAVAEESEEGVLLEASLPGFSEFALVADVQAPMVLFAQDGATLDGIAFVEVSVSDNRGVESVVALLNGEPVEASLDGETLLVTLDPALAPGEHSLEVTATDLSGLTTTESFSFLLAGDDPGPSGQPGQEADEAAESPLPVVGVLLGIALLAWASARRRHR
jgi:PGF-pre-PGF domain-containing protein